MPYATTGFPSEHGLTGREREGLAVGSHEPQRVPASCPRVSYCVLLWELGTIGAHYLSLLFFETWERLRLSIT